MKLTLYRKTLTSKSTIGELYVNGAFFCFTLEDTVRPEGVKVYAETAIPAGAYSIALTYSNRFKVIMPLVVNVPMFEGVRIHPGNSAINTAGCILVGKTKGNDWIGESRAAYQDLFRLLQQAIAKEKIELEIVNPQSSIRNRVETVAIPPAPTQASAAPASGATVTPSASVPVAPPVQLSPLEQQLEAALAEAHTAQAQARSLAAIKESDFIKPLSIVQRIHDALLGSGKTETQWALSAILAWPLWNEIATALAANGVQLPQTKGQWITLAVAVGRLLIQRGSK